MSIIISSILWRKKLPPLEKLVLLRLADYATDAGGGIYPSVDRVATECGVSGRHVQRVLKIYVTAGMLVIGRHGGGRHRTNEYGFNLEVLKRLPEITVSGETVTHSHGDNFGNGDCGSPFPAKSCVTNLAPTPQNGDPQSPITGETVTVTTRNGDPQSPITGETVTVTTRNGDPQSPDSLRSIEKKKEEGRGGGVRLVTESSSAPLEIIREFDNARAAAWGDDLRRPWPAATDRLLACRWIESGLTVADATDLFRIIMTKMKRSERRPPDTLKYFDNAVAQQISEKSKPRSVEVNDGKIFNRKSSGVRPSPHNSFITGFAQAALDFEEPDNIF